MKIMEQQFDILIIENEQVVIEAAKKILTHQSFTVDEALNSEVALQKLQQHRFKLIISDLMLPRISGIDLIEKVNHANPEIPIIIITGYAMLENAVKCFKVGAFDFIPKPFDVEELVGVVHRAMRHIEIMRTTSKRDTKLPPLADRTGTYYFLGKHSWAKVDQDGVTTFGVGVTFSGRMGAIQQVELPNLNSEVWQGNLCARIISQDQLLHMVWAPLSGKVIDVNREVEQNPNLINTDPFNHGWLIKVIPTNLEKELENLTADWYHHLDR